VTVSAGSPFTVKVNGPPDPSKVRVSGPGIHNGILQQYDGSFTVNTQGAGPGELTVKIRGPKGLCCRESRPCSTSHCRPLGGYNLIGTLRSLCC